MADPFSVVAGIIGTAAICAHTARRLKEFLDSIKDGPGNVKSISEDLGILQYSLTALEDLLRGGDDFPDVARSDEGRRCITSLTTILSHCQRTLESIHATIKPFVEKRNGSKEHKWRTMAGWMNRKDTLDSLKRELVSAKMTLDLGVSFANFLSTRAGIAQLRNQFVQLNTRLEQEASEDNMSDVGSASVVTDLGFALRRFLREQDPTAASSDPFTTDNERKPEVLSIDTQNAQLFSDHNDEDHHDYSSQSKQKDIFNSKESSPTMSSVPETPLTKNTTFSSMDNGSLASPVTSFTASFIQPAERDLAKPDMYRTDTKTSSRPQSSSIQHDRLSEHLSLELVSSGLYNDDAGWDVFQVPLKVFSDYFGLSHKKMMKKSPTSMLNFGIVTAKPISNSPAYADNHGDNHGDTRQYSWDQINDPKLYRHSAPHWALKIPGHKAAGKPPTRGVSRASLSKVVTNGASYDFIRLFVVAQKPENNTAYNFKWKPFCVFTYIGHPRRVRDIGMTESADDTTRTIPETTPVLVRLAIKDEMLTFRLKSSDDKHFLNSYYAYWSIDPNVITA